LNFKYSNLVGKLQTLHRVTVKYFLGSNPKIHLEFFCYDINILSSTIVYPVNVDPLLGVLSVVDYITIVDIFST